MQLVLRVRFHLRLPYINKAIYGNPGELRMFGRTVRPFLNSIFSQFDRVGRPVVIRISAMYDSVQYAVDPDNIFVKPIIDSLAEFVLKDAHDGYKEVVEVRKRVIVGPHDKVMVEVWMI